MRASSATGSGACFAIVVSAFFVCAEGFGAGCVEVVAMWPPLYEMREKGDRMC